MLFASVVAALCASFFALLFAAAMGQQLAEENRSAVVTNLVLSGAMMTFASALWVLVGVIAGAVLP